MKLVVTEKNDAAQKIADLLGVKKPKADKVYSTPVYRFDVDGEEWVTIGLRGHILEPDFAPTMVYKSAGDGRASPRRAKRFRRSCPRRCRRPPVQKEEALHRGRRGAEPHPLSGDGTVCKRCAAELSNIQGTL